MLSLLLHVAVLAEPFVFLRILSVGDDTPKAFVPLLQATLASSAAQRQPDRSADEERSKRSSRQTETRPRKRLQPEPPVTPRAEAIPAADSAETSLAIQVPKESAVVENAAASDANVERLAPSAAVEPAEPHEPIPSERRLPRAGELSYDLYWSESHWLAGTATHRWSIDDQGHYTLSSESMTTGIFALLNPLTINDETTGQLTGRGLSPSRFVTRSNAGAPAEVRFDWQNRRITFDNNLDNRAESIDGDVYDKLSFIYQLYLMQPKEKTFSVSITLGYRLELYLIEIIGAEEIETGVGTLNTVHLKRVNAGQGDNHVEVWLAPTMDFLPVKMRFFNDRGQYYEQIISSVQYQPG